MTHENNTTLENLFPGNSEMAKCMRAFNWTTSELGSPENWPPTLKISIRIILASPSPMFIWWGNNLITLYNDGFANFLLNKHPDALGQPASLVWPEIWKNVIAPRIARIKNQNTGIYDEAMDFIDYRKGFPEKVYATFSFIPVQNDEGKFDGIICPFLDETDRIYKLRQMTLFNQLAMKTLEARNRQEIYKSVADALQTDINDIPFSLFYELDNQTDIATLEAGSGIHSENLAVFKTFNFSNNPVWPLGELFTHYKMIELSDFKSISTYLPLVEFQYPITQIVILPLAYNIDNQMGALIVGLNPLRPFDKNYQEFLYLIAKKVSSAIQRIAAFELEKNRVETLAELNHAKTLQQSETKIAIELENAKELQRISSSLIEEDKIETFYVKILDAACKIMHSDSASIQKYIPEQNTLLLLAHKGFDQESADRWKYVRPDYGTACALAMTSNARVIIPDVENWPFFTHEHLIPIRKSGLKAIQSTPLMTRDGRLVGVISTHWRKVHHPDEKELRLFDMLARQAADLIERRMMELKLKDMDRRKDDFLAMLSHELRNPLATITTCIHILSRAPAGSSSVLRSQNTIKSQVTQITRLVDDLLDISRINKGKIQLQLQQVDINEIVSQVVADNSVIFEALGITLHTKLANNVALTMADPVRIAQMINNLLQNASKFSQRGGTTEVLVDFINDNSEVVIRIIDDGVGIDPALIQYLFEPFIQSDRTLDRSKGGLGLGLSLVKRLAELHNGTVHAHSAGEGRGAEFTITLPLSQSVDPGKIAEIKKLKLNPNRTVLIIEDNIDAADSLSTIVEMFGHSIHIAHNGPEGIQKAHKIKPHFILCDIGLPGMNGYEVAKILKNDVNLRSTTLIALSGYAQDNDIQKAHAAGFDIHLAKPPNLALLEQLLAEI